MDGQTLMITTRVVWNNVGFASGSRTVDDDWKLWNRLVISLDNAKLLRNKTCEVFFMRDLSTAVGGMLTRLEIAALKRTNNVSS